MKKLQEYLFIISITPLAFACQSPENDLVRPKEPERTVRDLYTYSISFPAVWNESANKTFVNKISFAFDEEFYFFYLTTEEPRKTQIIGQTETRSIRRNYTRSFVPSLFVNDMLCYLTPLRDPETLTVGGIDQSNIYSSIYDLDQFALSSTSNPAIARHINFKGYSTQFTSITKAHFLGEDTYRDNHFIAGNAYEGNGQVRPFVATYNMSRIFMNYDSITTLAFFDDLIGIEALTVHYDWEIESLFLAGYDIKTNEVVILCYKEEDINGNHVHNKSDSFKKIWEKRLVVIIDKNLFQCSFTNKKVFVAGAIKTDGGDLAGKLIALEASTGSIALDTLFDLSDDDDGFYGISTSGLNIFAYGFSNRVPSSNTSPLKSNGWALKLNLDGKPLANHLYKEENAVIEFTTATGGYYQSNFNKEGTLAIGGSKRTSEGYKAFATEFPHKYND
jgi:hypothetical protein